MIRQKNERKKDKGNGSFDHVEDTPECQAGKIYLIDKHEAPEAGSRLKALKESRGALPITLVVGAGRPYSQST